MRYLFLSMKTLIILLKMHPDIVFAQNPSIVLSALLCFLAKIFCYKLLLIGIQILNWKQLIIDTPKWVVFHILSRYTTKMADLTIVTNNYLRNLIVSWGGKGFILPDKIPNIEQKMNQKLF